MEIHNSKELKERFNLQNGDQIYFTFPDCEYVYTVMEMKGYVFLYSKRFSGYAIFNALGLVMKEHCEEIYEYKSTFFGGWNCGIKNDYYELKRVILSLYLELEKQCNIILSDINEKTNRFELLDFEK